MSPIESPTLGTKTSAHTASPKTARRKSTTSSGLHIAANRKSKLGIAPAGNLSVRYLLAKRAFDFVGAAVLIALFAPVLIATFLVLLVTTRGRPLFIQQRVGRCGKMFPMFKFRTMVIDAEARQADVKNEQAGPVFKNRCDPRVTPLGRWLRAYSIDELPQLFNVLAGQMSLVGPRPPVLNEVTRYKPWQRKRLSVKPGLTCLWQVSGRCEIGFDDWVRMDLWYVEHQSLVTDLKLLIATPGCVLSRRGAY
jgi:lipopolysaccharide/colanic/teichoic acid biosynthesis glycosyltransferase